MAIKGSRIDKSLRRLRRRRDDPEKTRAYTPGELHRLAHQTANNAGVIRPDTGDLNIPSDLDNLGESQQTDHPSGVVLVIVTLALIFIALITYFVSQMPDPPERDKAEQNMIDGRGKGEANR